MNALTVPQLELWVHQAIKQREERANLHAYRTTERICEVLVAAGILKRR